MQRSAPFLMKTASFLPGPPPDTTGDQDAAQWHDGAGGEEERNSGSLQRPDGLHEQTGMCMKEL